MMDRTVFIIGFTVMALSSLIIYTNGKKSSPALFHTLIHATVPFIASTAYLAMAFGYGSIALENGVTIYMARYADWAITTPILLAGLVMLALSDTGKQNESGGFLTAITTLDVLMVVAGLISALSESATAKWIWYLWSCGAFLGVIFLLWFPLMKMAGDKSHAVSEAYRKNLELLTIIWFIYPIVFLIGPEGLKVVTDPVCVWAFLILDIIAKVFYAFYSATNVDKAVRSVKVEGLTRA